MLRASLKFPESLFKIMEVVHLIPKNPATDNYMYIAIDQATKHCVAIDPLDHSQVLEEIKKRGLTLKAILATHHHWDHSDGNESLKQSTGVDVHGGSEKVKGINKVVSDGDCIDLGANVSIKCIATPCHTTDHICYHATVKGDQKQAGAVFTGDTLFLGGCGKFFEGTGAQMHTALIEKLGSLPGETLVYCGHEYTLSNLHFARSVDKNNKRLDDWFEQVKLLRAENKPTIPGTIEQELQTNPFMRIKDPGFVSALSCTSAVEAMDKLRNMKNEFRPPQ